ncbi:MAG: glycosyltransferase [Vulcanimicrobiaceae bacterium]
MRIAAVFPAALEPAAGSAARRLGALCAGLATAFDLQAVTLVEPGDRTGASSNPWSVPERRIPMTPGYADARLRTVQRDGAPADALALIEATWLTPHFQRAVDEVVVGADYVMTVPWLAAAVRACTAAPIVLVADRVEYLARRAAFGDAGRPGVLHRIATLEGEACALARWVVVPDARDGALLAALYEVDPQRVVVVPSATTAAFPDAVQPVFGGERRALKASSTLADQRIAVLVASGDGANLALVREAVALARALPDVLLVVVGGVAERVAGIAVPPTMKYLGRVDDATYDLMLGCADVALAPRSEATGVDLRILDYLRRGVPVVTTRAGVLGINAPTGLIATSLDDLGRCVGVVLGDPVGAEALAREGYAAFGRATDGDAGVRDLCARLAGAVVAA